MKNIFVFGTCNKYFESLQKQALFLVFKTPNLFPRCTGGGGFSFFFSVAFLSFLKAFVLFSFHPFSMANNPHLRSCSLSLPLHGTWRWALHASLGAARREREGSRGNVTVCQLAWKSLFSGDAE